MTNSDQPQPVTIACDLNAIPAHARDAHNAITRRLFASVLAASETDGGYAFSLPATSEALLQASQFIANERLCCPFINFGIEVASQQQGIQLRMTGAEGVKQFLYAEFAVQLPRTVALRVDTP